MRRAILFCLAAVYAITPAEANLQTETRQVHLGPVEQGHSPYVYQLFTVPSDATEITVHLDYDRAGGENAIDFAIFDARFSGRDDDLTGYRGKNSNRLPLVSVIGRTYASSGHIAGQLPPGIWRVMFYVYKTKPAGVDVTLRISVASEGRQEPDGGPGWYRGDLHMHTLHSDGSWTVTSLAAAAQEAALDFIAITDHNAASHHADIDAMPAGGPLLLKGVEVTTYGGHMNAWGVPAGTVLEHRQLPGDNAAIERMVAEVHKLGARISINHPFAACKACDWAFDRNASHFDGIEVWNGPWDSEDQRALDWWVGLLRSGRRVTAIGSSDSHGPQNLLGVPTIHLYGQNRDSATLLDAIGEGRAMITASPRIRANFEAKSPTGTIRPGGDLVLPAGSSAQFTLTLDGAPPGEAILYSAEGEIGRWAITNAPFRQEITVPAVSRFFLMEARDERGGMIALTNPIWVANHGR